MTKGRKITQLALIFFGFFLILATYFLYPRINKNVLDENKITKSEIIEEKDGKELTNAFENVEYNGVYSLDNDFKVKSQKAYISEDKPDIVFMTNMEVAIYMNDGRVITITSDEGKYNKVTYDCFFIDNVKKPKRIRSMKGNNERIPTLQQLESIHS